MGQGPSGSPPIPGCYFQQRHFYTHAARQVPCKAHPRASRDGKEACAACAQVLHRPDIFMLQEGFIVAIKAIWAARLVACTSGGAPAVSQLAARRRRGPERLRAPPAHSNWLSIQVVAWCSWPGTQVSRGGGNLQQQLGWGCGQLVLPSRSQAAREHPREGSGGRRRTPPDAGTCRQRRPAASEGCAVWAACLQHQQQRHTLPCLQACCMVCLVWFWQAHEAGFCATVAYGHAGSSGVIAWFRV